MHAYGGVALPRVLFREVYGVGGLLEIGAGDEELADADRGGALQDCVEVGRVGGFGVVVVEAAVGVVSEVDADLRKR